jgi:hypothetical protein
MVNPSNGKEPYFDPEQEKRISTHRKSDPELPEDESKFYGSVNLYKDRHSLFQD